MICLFSRVDFKGGPDKLKLNIKLHEDITKYEKTNT